jgi:hypothetical protein
MFASIFLTFFACAEAVACKEPVSSRSSVEVIRLRLCQSYGTTTIRQKPLALSPTYEVQHSDGSRSTIRQKPLALSPTYEVQHSDGSRSTIRQKPLTLSPTYEVDHMDSTGRAARQRVLESTPVWADREQPRNGSGFADSYASPPEKRNNAGTIGYGVEPMRGYGSDFGSGRSRNGYTFESFGTSSFDDK